MDPSRLAQLERLADRELSFEEWVGLDSADREALAQLGLAAFESGRFERAAQIFAGLETFDPAAPVHSLRRARAELQAGRRDTALEILTRYIRLETPRPKADLEEALTLRSTLLTETDPEMAALDLRAAHLLGKSRREQAR